MSAWFPPLHLPAHKSRQSKNIIQEKRIGYVCKTSLSECDSITVNLMTMIMGAQLQIWDVDGMRGGAGSRNVNIRGRSVYWLKGIRKHRRTFCCPTKVLDLHSLDESRLSSALFTAESSLVQHYSCSTLAVCCTLGAGTDLFHESPTKDRKRPFDTLSRKKQRFSVNQKNGKYTVKYFFPKTL